MKVLITGGAGFIGSNFVHYWLKNHPSDEVVVLDALTYAGNLENLAAHQNNAQLTFVQGDICDPAVVTPLVDACDIVVHFAAESHVDRSIKEPGVFVQTNVVGTQVLLQAALQSMKRFHHVSTDEVFGSLTMNEAELFSETRPYDPRSPYAASKAASDHLVRAYFHTYGLPITISNCTNNYGPWHFPEKMIPLFITRLQKDETIPVYGDGHHVRDWLYVEDHCSAIDAIIQRGKIGETYCIGGQAEKSNLEVARLLLSKLGKTEESITYVQDRPGHDERYAMDITKIRTELGWQPSVTFEEGITRTIQWFADNTVWVDNCTSGAYQTYVHEHYKQQ